MEEVEVKSEVRCRSQVTWQELEMLPVEAIKVYSSWAEKAADRMTPFSPPSPPPGLMPPLPSTSRTPRAETYLELKKHLEAIKLEQQKEAGQSPKHKTKKAGTEQANQGAPLKILKRTEDPKPVTAQPLAPILKKPELTHNRAGGIPATSSWMHNRPWIPNKDRRLRTQEASPDACRVFQSAIQSLESTGHVEGARALQLAIPSLVKQSMVRFDLDEAGKSAESLAPLVWRKRGGDNSRTQHQSSRQKAGADYSPYPSPNPLQSGKYGGSSKDTTPTKKVWRATPTSKWSDDGGRLKKGGRWRPVVTNNRI